MMTPLHLRISSPSIFLGLALSVTSWSSGAWGSNLDEYFDCPVTISTDTHHRFGNDALSTTLWSLGVVLFTPDGPGTIYDDGSLGMKWHWGRHIEGPLEITGHRLDQQAPPLRSWIPDGYGLRGFHTSGLIFPTPGCWEVTGSVADTHLTFVTLVIDLCRYGALCK